MPVEERIPNERLNLNQRLTFLLKKIEDTVRGRDIILSRADPVFVEKLFAREVPEIASKSVEIKALPESQESAQKLLFIHLNQELIQWDHVLAKRCQSSSSYK